MHESGATNKSGLFSLCIIKHSFYPHHIYFRDKITSTLTENTLAGSCQGLGNELFSYEVLLFLPIFTSIFSSFRSEIFWCYIIILQRLFVCFSLFSFLFQRWGQRKRQIEKKHCLLSGSFPNGRHQVGQCQDLKIKLGVLGPPRLELARFALRVCISKKLDGKEKRDSCQVFWCRSQITQSVIDCQAKCRLHVGFSFCKPAQLSLWDSAANQVLLNS